MQPKRGGRGYPGERGVSAERENTRVEPYDYWCNPLVLSLPARFLSSAQTSDIESLMAERGSTVRGSAGVTRATRASDFDRNGRIILKVMCTYKL